MKLSVWTYEGAAPCRRDARRHRHEGLHYVLHAPQGDTYADLLFTMIERRDHRPPVTYTTFQARDLGADTANLFKTALQDAYDRFQPQAMIVGASCTAELIQDDPGGMAETMGIPVPGRAAGTALLSAEGEFRRRRDLLPAGPGAGAADGARPTSPASTCSGPPRSAFATATTSPRSPGCWPKWASR
jgi:hypothetical protein